LFEEKGINEILMLFCTEVKLMLTIISLPLLYQLSDFHPALFTNLFVMG